MHFDLWLSIRGAVASTPESEGGRGQAEALAALPFCELKATRRARLGVRTGIIATSMDVMEPFASLLVGLV